MQLEYKIMNNNIHSNSSKNIYEFIMHFTIFVNVCTQVSVG